MFWTIVGAVLVACCIVMFIRGVASLIADVIFLPSAHTNAKIHESLRRQDEKHREELQAYMITKYGEEEARRAFKKVGIKFNV